MGYLPDPEDHLSSNKDYSRMNSASIMVIQFCTANNRIILGMPNLQLDLVVASKVEASLLCAGVKSNVPPKNLWHWKFNFGNMRLSLMLLYPYFQEEFGSLETVWFKLWLRLKTRQRGGLFWRLLFLNSANTASGMKVKIKTTTVPLIIIL